MTKILAKHKWLTDCIIYEMINTKTKTRYFVATILGWKGFYFQYIPTNELITEIKHIRNLIAAGDEKIFENKKYFKKSIL